MPPWLSCAWAALPGIMAAMGDSQPLLRGEAPERVLRRTVVASSMISRSLHPFVIRHARVGDMIMLTALLDLLRRRYGGPCDVVGAGPWNDSIFLGHPDVRQCWVLPRHIPFVLASTWPRLVLALRRAAPGPIYVAEHHHSQLPRIKRLLATSGIDMRRCVFIDEVPGQRGHWTDALLALGKRTPPALKAAEYPLPQDCASCAPRLAVLDSERVQRDAWLRERGWSGRPLVLIQPGNHRSMTSRSRRRWLHRDDKSWPVEHWHELLCAIRARLPDAVLALRGAVDELPMLRQMRAAIGLDGVEALGTELRPLFALIEIAHSMISVDTGPAHAAAALGLPVVVLYGAHSPGVWLPRSPSGSAVIGLGGPPVAQRADQIEAAEVLEAWCSLSVPVR